MFKYFLVSLVIFCSLSFGQTFQWVNIVTTDYQFNPSYLHAPSAIDNSGNPVCARLVYFQSTSGTSVYGEIKLEKRNASGSLIWENTFLGKADISEIAVDQQNNVFFIGTFLDTVVMGHITLIQTGSNHHSFVGKTDDEGNFLWAKDLAEFAPQYSEVSALELKSSGNLLVGTTKYNTTVSIYEFDTDGNIVSTIQQAGAGTISDITEDVSGNIWATGFTFNGAISFNDLDTIAPFSYNEYVVKYNSSGTALWVNFIEDITVQDFNIESDNFGNVYLSGNLFESTQFGNLTANGPEWVYDFFITKIDPDGNYLWLREVPPGNTLGDATIGNSNFLSCGENGDTYLTGFIRGEVDFGNGVTLSSSDYYDVFVISYNSDGLVQWAKGAGSDTYNQGYGIVTNNNGSCFVTGIVGQNAVFDTISFQGGTANLFLTRLMFDTPTGNDEELVQSFPAADEYLLLQNYPNPFNPTTKIKFSIPTSPYPSPYQGEGTRERFLVTLNVYDILGNQITTLVNEEKSAGTYEVNFDASGLPSGIYFYKLTTPDFIQTKKMILLK
jgi:hypothetical protein